jgi:hypothetical protein
VGYFWANFLGSGERAASLEDAFARILGPAEVAEAAHAQVAGAHRSDLAVYRGKKAIRDILMQRPDGSWLALIGSPLVVIHSEAEEHAFVDRFFERPEDVLRNEIDGHFAVVAHDVNRGRFILATDSNSIIPIFFGLTPDGVIVASHELPVATSVDSELDPFGVAQFVHLGTTWETTTRFRDVSKLTPCEVVTFDNDLAITRDEYWSPEHEEVWSGDLDEHVDRWLPLLCGSVKSFYEVTSAPSVLSDFTAGEDARIVLAACHGAGIPFQAFVGGSDGDTDVRIAREASERLGFDLIQRVRRQASQEQVEAHVVAVAAESDGYKDLFLSLQQFATDTAEPLDPTLPKFGGMPGGEAYRGSYYLRAKGVRPDSTTPLDDRWFTRLKFLLDFSPGLMQFEDREFLEATYATAARRARQVQRFPLGTQVDHMLRLFQTSVAGLRYRSPLYLPLATTPMTRSIYQLRPRWKKAGRLTRASTESLWPELAMIRTQNGVPTVRKLLRRQHLFLPEYLAIAKKIYRGFDQRVLKRSPPPKISYSVSLNHDVLAVLMHRSPYSEWFTDINSMATGWCYDGHVANALLNAAREGHAASLPVLGRMLSLELALRAHAT